MKLFWHLLAARDTKDSVFLLLTNCYFASALDTSKFSVVIGGWPCNCRGGGGSRRKWGAGTAWGGGKQAARSKRGYWLAARLRSSQDCALVDSKPCHHTAPAESSNCSVWQTFYEHNKSRKKVGEYSCEGLCRTKEERQVLQRSKHLRRNWVTLSGFDMRSVAFASQAGLNFGTWGILAKCKLELCLAHGVAILPILAPQCMCVVNVSLFSLLFRIKNLVQSTTTTLGCMPPTPMAQGYGTFLAGRRSGVFPGTLRWKVLRWLVRLKTVPWVPGELLPVCVDLDELGMGRRQLWGLLDHLGPVSQSLLPYATSQGCFEAKNEGDTV